MARIRVPKPVLIFVYHLCIIEENEWACVLDWLDEMLNLWEQAHSILIKINIVCRPIPRVKPQKKMRFFFDS
jgi:hypothetical protein